MSRISLLVAGLAAVVPIALAPTSGAAGAAATSAPTFRSYPAPADKANDAGEPTIGVNPKTGAVMFIAGLKTYRIGDFDARGAGTSTWTDVSYFLTSIATADPILETDTTTGRTFVNQLMYSNPGSVMAYTDDDGKTWTPVPYGSGVGLNIDHQTVGFGPWVKGSPFQSPTGYPNAIYYCTNDAAASDCAISLDGGDTFLPARPAYLSEDCAAIHGHLKSAPDGTIYLPPDGCTAIDGPGDPAGVVVSRDNSFSWSVKRVPGSDSGDAGHPSIGIASDGALYLAYGSKTAEDEPSGPVQVAKTTDRGESWTKPVTLGAELGVKAASFPVAVAGDPGRAAVGFLGTTDEENPRREATFTGRWDLYISTTYDGGATWHTVNATPDNPIQIGSICTGGLSCGSDRNLLDFNDMVIDERGRIVVGLADGCVKTTCTKADRAQHGLLVRQVSGKGLLAEFDATATDGSTPSGTGGTGGSGGSGGSGSGQPAPSGTGGFTHPATGLDPALPVTAAALTTVGIAWARRRRRLSAQRLSR
jgi:hypothetical protein